MKKKEIKKLDTLWSAKIKEKAGYKCEYCGRVGIKHGGSVWLNSCHIIGRRHRATRWGAWINGKYDLCGFCGCYEHHNQYDEHGPQEEDIKQNVIGLVRYGLIRKFAKNKVAKNQDFEEIKKWIEEA